jgi:D-tyrosyl-tRNA(Tyr) deacylase
VRAVVQRVSRAAVRVDGAVAGEIGRGLVVLLGVGREDGPEDADALAGKVANLRVFDDPAGQMNLSALDVGGAVLVVSQFTLYGDCRRGRRPSYVAAAPPEEAQVLYRRFVAQVGATGLGVAEGVFRAMMQVELVNDGPVTLLLDSKGAF